MRGALKNVWGGVLTPKWVGHPKIGSWRFFLLGGGAVVRFSGGGRWVRVGWGGGGGSVLGGGGVPKALGGGGSVPLPSPSPPSIQEALEKLCDSLEKMMDGHEVPNPRPL